MNGPVGHRRRAGDKGPIECWRDRTLAPPGDSCDPGRTRQPMASGWRFELSSRPRLPDDALTAVPETVTPMKPTDAYRPDIDGLRALSVIVVVLFHAGLGVTGGFVGVDVFFVISGYLITSLILKQQAAGRFETKARPIKAPASNNATIMPPPMAMTKCR